MIQQINMNKEDLWEEASRASMNLTMALDIAANPDWDLQTRTNAAAKAIYVFARIGKMFPIDDPKVKSINFDDFLGSITVALEETDV